ncbi:O-acetyl-ADP-ribose deacetylase (regulator of RNase III) [Paraburkholderia sp. BL6665CI2N2]|uniref:type II toxin-antitoxin system antitoxin DNA ADP-ribosyl glycohydrolase DarG n=1 Tax=Paraburkholderia sp. BL6665CI2N2 TaxID=1938806 RepID=UPI001065F45C|nr:macro domain-containing protein [Paraburkholderia sp. BL6665CI2N2]TDY16768.1 O-acetyl-ADP-ribose deacetylase (regulator of RNase III) [Paraburkholderia sp. BL6665CI2N2]
MITYTHGNLLEAPAEALVNTVNTVGVMGKGIALMFKEQFPENFREYAIACKEGRVQTGKMFVTERMALMGPRWIVNFPTKQNWRAPSRLEWIVAGLNDLRQFIEREHVQSIAIPPLGAGNGGLDWPVVKAQIDAALGGVSGTEILVYEPIAKYQNVSKREGVEKLTPARALIAELVRRYWVLGMECSLLEIQKLAWFLERVIERTEVPNPLKLQFIAHTYGPYANRLEHLLNNLDGSYLHCDKRIADADPLDVIWFEDRRSDVLAAYLKSSEMKPYLGAVEETASLIDGFESPFGLELLASLDWLLVREGCTASVESIRTGLAEWPGGESAGRRKHRLFDERAIQIGLTRLTEMAHA